MVVSLESSSAPKSRKRLTPKFSGSVRNLTERTQKAIDALVLWILHEKFGFGRKRLRAFYDFFNTEIDALVKRYEMGDEDKAWLCTYMLKRYGIDISEWNKEENQ